MSNPTLEDLMGLNDPDYLSQDLLSQDFSFFYSGKIIYDLNIKHYLGTNFLDSINITNIFLALFVIGVWAAYCLTTTKTTTPKESCPVCGDDREPLHFHYGARVCRGCKSFFLESLRRHQTLRCKRDGDCTINIHTRKACRPCRFRRCQDAGTRRRGDRMPLSKLV